MIGKSKKEIDGTHEIYSDWSVSFPSQGIDGLEARMAEYNRTAISHGVKHHEYSHLIVLGQVCSLGH
jgi:hypothetical protein